MKKSYFVLAAALLTLMPSCQSDEQETMMNASDEVTVSFGMDFGIDDMVLTRAENNVEYLIAISPAAPVDGKITSGYVGRFSTLSAANATLKANTSYNFYISAYESLGDACDLSSVCATEGEFVEVSDAVSYAPDFADQRVDRYYGTTTETLEGNTTISVEGKRYVYGIKVNIEKPSTCHVTLTSDSPALSYNVTSNAADAVVEQNIFCLAGTDPEGSKTTLVTVTLFDKSDKKVSSVSKEITIARNHSKTLTVKAIDPLASFDFAIEEGDMTEENVDVTLVAEDPFNGHDYVDLGVVVDGAPVYWATCNVGAEHPADYGLYFAWGDTMGHDSNGIEGQQYDGYSYDWITAPFNGGYSGYFGPYFSSIRGEACPNNVLSLEYDAAHVNWQGAWRMPTKAEQEALLSDCDLEWTTMTNPKGKSVDGLKVSNKEDSNKYIFLPAAGCRYYNNFAIDLIHGLYWSSTLDVSDNSCAYYLDILSPTKGNLEPISRFGGLSVRPVCQ